MLFDDDDIEVESKESEDEFEYYTDEDDDELTEEEKGKARENEINLMLEKSEKQEKKSAKVFLSDINFDEKDANIELDEKELETICNNALSDAINNVEDHKTVRKNDLNNYYNNFIYNLKRMNFKNGGLEKFVLGTKLSFGRAIVVNNLFDKNDIESLKIKNFFFNTVESVKNILGNNTEFNYNNYYKLEEKLKDYKYTENNSFKDIYDKSNLYIFNDKVIDEISKIKPDEYSLKANDVIDNEPKNIDTDLKLFSLLAKKRESYNSRGFFDKLFGSNGREERNTINKIKDELMKRGYTRKEVNSITSFDNVKTNFNKINLNKNLKLVDDRIKFIKSLGPKTIYKFAENTLSNDKDLTIERFKTVMDALKDIDNIKEAMTKPKDIIKMNDNFQVIQDKLLSHDFKRETIFDMLKSKDSYKDMLDNPDYIEEENDRYSILMDIDDNEIQNSENDISMDVVTTELTNEITRNK